MKIIEPYSVFEPVDGFRMLRQIEKAGRVCYKSEDLITDESAPKFAASILKRGHESVVEHEKVSVRVICDRGVTHEIVRHRLASYSQESTRYCNYSGGVTFILPPWVIMPAEMMFGFDYGATKVWSIFPDPIVEKKEIESFEWFKAMIQAERAYRNLLERGWSPQQARSVLPNSLKTEIVMTCNLREWRHFLKLRTAKAAHPQMRQVAIPMLKEFKRLIPVIFDDIEPYEETAT